MRLRWIVLSALLLPGCISDYEGESFPLVVESHEVESVDVVPDDARVIGFVSDNEEHTLNHNGLIERALYCDVEDRLIRRMKRAASDQGGEFLVDVLCETTQEEDNSSIHDDPETSEVESSVHCWTYCEADVARGWIHDL